MSFTTTYTRADLQQQEAIYKKKLIMDIIGNDSIMSTSITFMVLQAARQGYTQYFWQTASNKRGAMSYPPPPVITNEEIIEVLKEKFPNTTVEYQETWVEVRAGVKEQKKGILIDWS